MAGFIAHAGPRLEGATRSANDYDSELLGVETQRDADRERGQSPPYRFSKDDERTFAHWAKSLVHPDVLLLDGFRRVECADGERFLLLPERLPAKPSAIVIGVRDENLGALEKAAVESRASSHSM